MNGVGMRMLPVLLFLFALVRGVWARDFVVTEMGASPDDGKDDTPAAQAAIDQCQVNPGSRLVFPPGRYDFFVGRNPKSKDTSLLFEGCKDLSIVGDAAELVFHGLTRALFFRDCRNVVVRQLVIDWERLPFSQGRVVALGPTYFDIRIPDEFPVVGGEPVQSYMEYDRATALPARHGLDGGRNVTSTELVAPQVLRLHLTNAPRVGVGAILVLKHQEYVYDAFRFLHCRGVTLKDVTIYAAAGMGLSAGHSEDFLLKRFRILIRPGTSRLMSTSADGTHFNDCAGEIRMQDCVFEGMGDDATNVHGMYLRVTEQADDRTVIAVCRHGWLVPPNVGDRIEFTRFESLLPYAERMVRAVSVDGAAKNHRIEFEQPLPEQLAMGDLLGNATRVARLRISGCAVRANRARGFVVQTRDAVIERNSFTNCSGAGIYVTTDGDFWTESIGTRRVVIRDNLFAGCNRGPNLREAVINVFAHTARWRAAGLSVHRDLTIEGNTICGTDNAAIAVAAADGVTIRNNHIEGCCEMPDCYAGRSTIFLRRSRNVRVIGNTLCGETGDAGMTEPVFIMPSCQTETIEAWGNAGLLTRPG